MFDVGASELLLIVIVAIVVIGPKDMPLALRTAGRWIGKIRRISGHFRTGVEAMIRETEMEEAERKWREHNERIMAAHPDTQAEPPPPSPPLPDEAVSQAVSAAPAAASAEARAQSASPARPAPQDEEEPLLPFRGPPPPP
ncbi:Sec-independent protein translocase protein TatB [Tsuneonella sp. CC-YZS046]|uniref:Sec-independent protein translocase protein TatB n=1 Tax=Tsuneonella sp. CC-YZS046 TaxID=3042152 RepID=UPI002D77BD76|nr:Sec-independent protein translocase protein TatB [Tsuneonella sp. CC-YZS046]WRO66913.1 Sec-independent protein translocase protein TatB [Tsuneonella sp. CC-YZS046]